MPRRQFVADLEELCNASSSVSANVKNVKRGDDDGTVSFIFSAPEYGVGEAEFAVMIPELSDYPDAHEVFTYASGDHIPAFMTEAIESLSLGGRRLHEAIGTISAALLKASITYVTGEVEMIDVDDAEEQEEYDSDNFSAGGWSSDGSNTGARKTNSTSAEQQAEALKQLQKDLQDTRAAGFRVGVLGSYKTVNNFYVSVSIRISKLGISEEALNAWKLDRKKYFIVVLHYTNGYRPLEELIGSADGAYYARRGLEFRVGTHQNYKPTLQQAIAAFTNVQKEDPTGETVIGTADGLETMASEEKTAEFEALFMSESLQELLNEWLLPVVKYRMNWGFSWDGAELYYSENKGRVAPAEQPHLDDHYYTNSASNKILVKIVAADALTDKAQKRPFPLLAMQYALRHLVRCTEFCLVCHNRVSSDFEALKPYVCSTPLCLYQYLSLGFGPSIEHEIISQPSVVDLLTCFCYNAARMGRLKDFPEGLHMVVPPVEYSQAAISFIPAQLNPAINELRVAIGVPNPNLKAGDWIVISSTIHSPQDEWHAKVLDTAYYPLIKIGTLIKTRAIVTLPPQHGVTPQSQYTTYLSNGDSVSSDFGTNSPPLPLEGTNQIDVKFMTYHQQFDALKPDLKQLCIVSLLNTLPSVSEMSQWLMRNTGVGDQASLKKWEQRISPSALACLRWIIASNRSCIVALNTPTSDTKEKKVQDMHSTPVHGMGGYVQFRFAMGAPDKEQRFVKAMKETQARLNLTYPTLFAFHGSAFHNWHSIIREGLHFNETINGRAFGHGCYHSLDVNTSIGYSGMHGRYGAANTVQVPTLWPISDLQITSALCLNEIVNAPQEFVSNNPHLVVSQLDWIQTRYMFVQCGPKPGEQPGQNPTSTPSVEMPTLCQAQDPNYTPKGIGQKPLVIPGVLNSSRPVIGTNGQLTTKASPKAKKRAPKAEPTKKKQRKSLRNALGLGTASAPLQIDDDSDVEELGYSSDISISTTFSDREALGLVKQKAPESDSDTRKGALKRSSSSMQPTQVTPWIKPADDAPPPVNLLPPPSYATPMASKRLQTDIKQLLHLQDNGNLIDHGFYLNPQHIDNIYHLPITLHSFPLNLPLSQGLKFITGPPIDHILLEFRFGPSYPMAPPFVRVVKPRFLPFLNGGGGNITAGGAMCMEMLTGQGWNAVSSLEAVIMQIRLAIMDEERPAKVDPRYLNNGGGRYDENEAKAAYIRACQVHGWPVGEDLNKILG